MPTRTPDRSPRTGRAFSMLELTTVLAISGILAALAVPSFQSMTTHYNSGEAARATLFALSEARALAQRINTPVKVTVNPRGVSIAKAQFAEGLDVVRKNVTGFTFVRDVTLPRAVTMLRVDTLGTNNVVTASANAGLNEASIIFCASSDTYFRDASTGVPVCGVGNLANQSAKVLFKSFGKGKHVRINSALGTLELKAGY